MRTLIAILILTISCHAQTIVTGLLATNIYYGKAVQMLVLPTLASNSVPVVVEITEENQWALKRLITRQINATNPGVSAATNMALGMFANQLRQITQNEHHLFQQEEQKALLGAHPEIRRRVRDLIGIQNPPPMPQ